MVSGQLTGCNACSAYEYTVPAQGREVVKTDLAIAIPSGTYARVAPRSGLAVKSFIDTGAGVIDEDYRGNVGVVLFNHGQTDFKGEAEMLRTLSFLQLCCQCCSFKLHVTVFRCSNAWPDDYHLKDTNVQHNTYCRSASTSEVSCLEDVHHVDDALLMSCHCVYCDLWHLQCGQATGLHN